MNPLRRAGAGLGCFLAMALAGLPAEALIVSGSFSGLARGNDYGGSYANVPLNGFFSIDLDAQPDPANTDIGSHYASWVMPDGSTLLRFRHNTGPFYDGEGPYLLSVGNYADRQEVSITSGVWFGGTLTLVSTPGGLVDGLDFRSFHPGPVNLAASRLIYGAHQETGESTVTALRFDTPTAPIPEPSIWAALLLGLGGMRLWARRRHVLAP